ncbi:MAG: ATP-grasp domain-containing protein [Candidatus Bathyarchaeota archaeon]|nr:ATP-grasp domain-containing protein [Candidatus Bathyarchaeota archaeon]
MDSVNVLITCSGGVISPSHIHSLRFNPDNRALKIIGTDINAPCIGQCIADKFYQVPPGDSPIYVEKMMEICSKESVDVLFPASHEEALVLSKNSDSFKKNGTIVAISKYDVLEKAFNKGRAYQTLKQHNLPCPEFRIVKSLKEFEDASHRLGIGEKKIVMKPVLSRGGRGARILTTENLTHHLLNDKPGYLDTSYDEALKALSVIDEKIFPELVLMEYLPGTIYSVDFLAINGEALMIVPKVRVYGNASQTIVGKVKRDPLIEATIRNISHAFGFDYTINIELGCNSAGEPLPFDFNPRVAASVAFCSAAGANILYYALKMALNEELPKVTVKDNILMLRYFKEQYLNLG